MHHDPNIAPQHIFDGVTLNDQAFQHSPSLPALHLSHPSPGSTSSLNDRHLEPPPTYEQLLVVNTQLKTRVNELEVINIMQRESENRLRSEIEAVRRNEAEFKRLLTDLEHLLKEKDADQPPLKRTRISDVTDE